MITFMIFNNWQFLWQYHNYALNVGKEKQSSIVSKLYFLSFMCIATYVIINILMAFVIDVYTSIEDSQKEEAEEKEAFIQLGKEQSKREKSLNMSNETFLDISQTKKKWQSLNDKL